MKQILNITVTGLLLIPFLFSCQTTSEFSSSKVIQKRKYTKGFHFNFRKTHKEQTAKSVTAKAFADIERMEAEPLVKLEVRAVGREFTRGNLLTASAEMQSEASKLTGHEWRKNIRWPGEISAIYTAEPERVIVQPAPAGVIIGFISSVVGIFIAGIPLGALGVILCAIGLGKIKENPGMRGKGLAIAGLVIGIIAIVGALIVIGNM